MFLKHLALGVMVTVIARIRGIVTTLFNLSGKTIRMLDALLLGWGHASKLLYTLLLGWGHASTLPGQTSSLLLLG